MYDSKKVVLGLATVLLMPGISFGAQPTINTVPNTIYHKQSVTITGVNFGTKSPAAPYFYDDFESHSDGISLDGQLGTVGSARWIKSGTTVPITYSSELSYGQGSNSVKKYSDGDDFTTAGIDGLDSSEVFISYKYRWSWSQEAPHAPSTIVKAARITAPGGWYNENPRLQLQTNLYNTTWTYFSQNNCSAFNDSKTVPYNTPDTWHSIDMYMKLSDPAGTNNGELVTSSDYVYGYNNKSIITRTSDCPKASIDSFILPFDVANDSKNHYTFYVDNVYFDNTQARVEIGDNPVFENCTAREIQIPSAWSDDSLTFTVNQGAFAEGEEVYLFVVNKNGEISDGKRVYFGTGYGAGVDAPPSLSFTAPTGGTAYTQELNNPTEELIIAGTASDDKAIQSVTYSTNNGLSGTATTSDGFNTWSAPITVHQNETVITTITAIDDAGQATSKTMTIRCTCPVAWDATVQTGDSTWTDSGVTYCVRLLVQGDSITDSASQVVLGFQGRTSGDYTIRNVSIAQRDPTGERGDVLDDTWQQVTFDGSAWSNTVTVGAGSEKYSDPVNLNLEPGKDYYVTFKIDTPSVYLDPPAGYEELYFNSEDHTSDIDWSGNGYNVTQDYHALSKIYIYSPNGSILPPASFQLQ